MPGAVNKIELITEQYDNHLRKVEQDINDFANNFNAQNNIPQLISVNA